MSKQLLPVPEPETLTKRNLTYDTCKRWRYGYGEMKHPKTGVSTRCQIATYFDQQGAPAAQKIRFPDKEFMFLNGGDAPLYGQHLWRDGGKRIIITEGEIDAMSVDQVMGHKWPVVSLPNGAQSARKALSRHVEWLTKFDEIVLMFDQDEPGREAMEQCAPLFPTGKVKIGVLPMKDANEMLVAGRADELRSACWEAKEYRPDGIVRVVDLHDELRKPVEVGLPWPWETLTKATYGRRCGETYAFGAGTGVGKTDVFTQIIAQTITELDLPVGTFFFEQRPVETIRRIAGKIAGKRFHIPDDSWTPEEYNSALDALEKSDKLFMYDNWGAADWEAVKSRIRFIVLNYGVKDIFLDHLTALVAQADDERVELERINSEMAMLAQELGFRLYFISHLATPEGKPHEEGGRVTIRHFKGSRSIGYWSHFMFGLERDQQAEDEKERRTTTFRVLKDRYTGNAVGLQMDLIYNKETGVLKEADADPFDVETPADQSQGAF